MLDKQVLVILTFCTWSSLGGIIHLDGLADDNNPISTVVFNEFIKDAPDVRITNRIPVKFPVPHLVPVHRVQTVEIPQPRPFPVDSPYAVPVSQPVPYAVPQEVPVPVSKPFPWPVPQAVPFPVTGAGHQGLEESLRQSLGSETSTAQHRVTTGPSEVSSVVAGSYTPQYQTETHASESSQQTDGTTTASPSSQIETDSGNPSSDSYYPAPTAADVQYVSEFLPLLKSYLEIFQQPTAQTGEPLQSSYALQFPVQNESHTTLENVSGAQSQSGAALTLPTTGTGHYLEYGLQDHTGLSLQSPGIQQTVLFSSHVTPQTSDESSVNTTAVQKQEAPESGQLITPQDHNGATTLPTSGNYLYSSQFIYPQFPHGEANNLLTNTQLYPRVYGFPSPQSTVNLIPGIQSATLDAANSGSSGNHAQQTESGTSADFQIQNSQTYENLLNYYLSQEKVNAQLISLQNLLSHRFVPTPPPTAVVSESPNQVPGQSPAPETVAVTGVEPETTESPQTIASDSPPAPLNISTAAPPVSIKTSNPPPLLVQERLEAVNTSGNALKYPVPLSEPLTTTTTVTQLEEKLPLTTTAPPETTTTPVLKTSPTPLVVTTAEAETVTPVLKTSPTPVVVTTAEAETAPVVKTKPTPVVVTTAEPQNIQISSQLQPKPTNFLDPQYRIISLPFIQPQLLTLPQQQRQQLQVVVTQV